MILFFTCFRFFEDTWMISASDKRVININGNLHNCDNNDDIEDEDIGIINDVNFIGITRVYVRKNENLTEISEGRLTISPIRCIDLSTLDQQVLSRYNFFHYIFFNL